MKRITVLVCFLGLLLFPRQVLAAPISFDMSDATKWDIRIDGPVAGTSLGAGNVGYGDFDQDGKLDIVIGAYAGFNSRANSGSVYVIYGSLLASLSGKGNTLDLSNPANYNLRFDGAAANDFFGASATVGDVNNNGIPDIVAGAPFGTFNARSGAGALYVIYDSILSSYSGTGNNIDLNTSANYNLRYEGPLASSGLSAFDRGIAINDIDNDGKNDLVLSAYGSGYNARSFSGSLFLIKGTLIDDYGGTGNNIDLATGTNYNVRWDGAAASDQLSNAGNLTSDLNGDGAFDILIGALGTDYNSRNNSGSFYLLYSPLILSYAGTGNTVDLANTANFNARFDGALASISFGLSLDAGDFFGDGKSIVVSATGTDYNSKNNSGSTYLIPNSVFSSLTSTGNLVDMATATNYSIRFDGPFASDNMAVGSETISDFNGDGLMDFMIENFNADANSRSNSGSLYVFYNNVVRGYTGTGNNVDLGASPVYNLKYDGAAASNSFGGGNYQVTADFYGDSKADLIVGAAGASFNSRAFSGSIYIIYNFPHSVNPSSFSTTTSAQPEISGTIDIASSSVTSLSGVEFNIDQNSPTTSSWAPCTTSGSGTSINFRCQPSSNLSLGDHTVYVRAYDTNGSYTAQSRYGSFTFNFNNGSGGGGGGQNPNQPSGYELPITSGPHFQGLNTFQTNGCAKVFMPTNASPNDLNTTIKQVDIDSVIYPWMQGYNLASDIYQVSVASAFNGYAITSLDNPMIVQMCFKPNLTSVSNLRMGYFNEVTSKWSILLSKNIVDQTTLSNTTKVPGYFAILYQNYISKTATKAKAPSKTTKTSKVKSSLGKG